MWTTTGGHPKSGESSLDGIVTEIDEELGISVDRNNLVLFKTIKTEDDFVDLYYLKMDINVNDIIIQEEEVEEAKWFSIDEINELIRDNKFLPPHIEFYNYCLEYLGINS
jgi:isopentenyldiphosphate isomerase